jgi:DNA modification methylase
MIADAILDTSKRGDLVLDGFLGAGSTVLAAERIGRVCFGIEIDPLYIDTIVRRWQRYSGELADAQTRQRFAELAVSEARRG